jgi:hypothetical protein
MKNLVAACVNSSCFSFFSFSLRLINSFLIVSKLCFTDTKHSGTWICYKILYCFVKDGTFLVFNGFFQTIDDASHLMICSIDLKLM